MHAWLKFIRICKYVWILNFWHIQDDQNLLPGQIKKKQSQRAQEHLIHRFFSPHWIKRSICLHHEYLKSIFFLKLTCEVKSISVIIMETFWNKETDRSSKNAFHRMHAARVLTISRIIPGGVCPPPNANPSWMQPPRMQPPLDADPLDANPLIMWPVMHSGKPTLAPPPVNRRNDTCLWKHYLPATTVAGGNYI